MIQRSLFDPPAPEPAAPDNLDTLRQLVSDCTRCPLASTRQQAVCGEGDPAARLMIVGEGPSESDDGSGHPFSGPSGAVLDRWLTALGQSRASVWLTNVIKSRAATLERGRLVNRPPTATELRACRPWLEAELRLIQPAVILGLGASAGRVLSGGDFKITQRRGQWFDGPNGIPTLVTYNPAYLMRLEEPQLSQAQGQVTADLAAVKAALDSAG